MVGRRRRSWSALGFLLADPISDQASSFQRDVPGYVDDANDSLADLQDWLDRRGMDIEVKQEGETALQTIGERITGGAGEVVGFTRDAVQRLVEASIALILIIVLSIYMLIYGDRIGAVVRAVVPPGDGTPDDDFPTRVQASLFGYVRGQFLFSLIMGTSAGLMLWVLGSLGIFPEGKTYAVAFGAWFGFAELIPYIGPAIGGFPPVIIAALSDNPLDAVWLIIAFTVLQQLEGHVVAPNVFGQALRINPLLVIFALLLGGEIAGFLGAFLALPIAAIVRETVVYLHRHLASSAGICRPRRRRRRRRSTARSATRSSPRGAAGVPARAGPSSATATPRFPPRPRRARTNLSRDGLPRRPACAACARPACCAASCARPSSSVSHLVYPMFVVGERPAAHADRRDARDRPPLDRRCGRGGRHRARRSASPPCCCSACRRARTPRAPARGTTRASSSSPRGRSRPPIRTFWSSPTSACASTRRTATAACCAPTAWSTTTRRSSCSRAPRSPRPRPAPTPSRRAT